MPNFVSSRVKIALVISTIMRSFQGSKSSIPLSKLYQKIPNNNNEVTRDELEDEALDEEEQVEEADVARGA